jgi:G3E family GTPase
LPITKQLTEPLESVKMDAVLLFSEEGESAAPGHTLQPAKKLIQLQLPSGETRFDVRIDKPGLYALFTQHHPDEFQAQLRLKNKAVEPTATHAYKLDHEHDDTVTSVGINESGDLDREKFQKWLSQLLMNQGPDIFRSKGILSIKGSSKRFVFQGVHMLFDCEEDRPWDGEARHNSLIFIGRKLNREQLTEGFRACLA